MKVAKWGNSLAVRLPAAVVEVLQLQDGDEIEIRAEGQRILTVCKKPDIEEMFARVRKLRGAIPRDFKFDRDEANER
ncbi:AbrB/MazE/SpoVT family DNA-binding domain-containing protein [Thermomonas sp.]|jgi:antitoxin MazE|uniref:AbrB/MazE/SpoVT family DNA-binding domain-containing protein n=1 Tax=Thermomonas sp. TaxID=1971895 RepID=UPI001EB71B52|nr:AbrB/MazE/SpoVT family DNA-binding domain-containing protein [Thermomonas sp.]MBK6415651.1 AbrB/MazE/SpoVT family DNA-binding domain-containing protein [Thermomonas sp.]MBK6924811.1 AbrB/MazE/SpoVT family DNA-binding domain-containing protein [Thermomonas sp.]MBL0227548.1 AbrB/MazE/SpoVT family DNA-binding domain-containing protein [Thermomonas sp.]